MLYMIVSGDPHAEYGCLDDTVQGLIDEGWEPLGGISVLRGDSGWTVGYQAMVLDDPDEEGET